MVVRRTSSGLSLGVYKDEGQSVVVVNGPYLDTGYLLVTSIEADPQLDWANESQDWIAWLGEITKLQVTRNDTKEPFIGYPVGYFEI